MAAEQARIPALPITSHRPAWVTDELVARWCAWVRREEMRHGKSAPEQRLMPLGPSPTSSAESFVHRTNRQLALLRRLGIR